MFEYFREVTIFDDRQGFYTADRIYHWWINPDMLTNDLFTPLPLSGF